MWHVSKLSIWKELFILLKYNIFSSTEKQKVPKEDKNSLEVPNKSRKKHDLTHNFLWMTAYVISMLVRTSYVLYFEYIFWKVIVHIQSVGLTESDISNKQFFCKSFFLFFTILMCHNISNMPTLTLYVVRFQWAALPLKIYPLTRWEI